MNDTTKCDRTGTLVLRTQTLVKDYSDGLVALSHRSKIPFWWLRKFAAGQIASPGANRLQYLYEYLTGKPLVK